MRKLLNSARVFAELPGWGLPSLRKEGLTEAVRQKTLRHRAQVQYTEGIYFPVQKKPRSSKSLAPMVKTLWIKNETLLLSFL
ncbi:hypothetical protein LEMLEM_LOCUS8426 [Lemmus lemmus]